MDIHTGLTSWGAVTTMYPFVGWEVTMFIIGVVVWIAFHFWQIKFENNSYDEQVSKLRGNLSKAVSGD